MHDQVCRNAHWLLSFLVQHNRLRLMSRTALSLLLGIAWMATPAQAHKMFVFARVEGSRIIGEVYFHGGDSASDVNVRVLAPDEALLGETTTDAEGNFTFEPQKRCDHQFVADAGFGHTATFTVESSELPSVLPAEESNAPASNLTVNSDAEVDASAKPQSQGPVVKRAELEELSRQISALRKDLAEWQTHLQMQDVLGGVGYILGITGMLAFWLSVKHKK